MAAEPAAPWSRWDDYGTTRSTLFGGTTRSPLYNVNQPQYDPTMPVGQTQLAQSSFMRGQLVEKRYNPLDPNFYDCVYTAANSANTIIEQCYKEIGCCNNGCCSNSYWRVKYGWAVALIVIFCILVVIFFGIWLVCWLCNRARDKNQKRELLQHGMSPAPSQVYDTTSLAQSPIQQSGYYPPTYNQGPPTPNGYRY